MRVLLAHVPYRMQGGEDAVVARDSQTLKTLGVDVQTLLLPSAQFESMSTRARLRLAASYPDHSFGRNAIRQAMSGHQPDIVHFHNLHPLLGTGAIEEAARLGARVVMTVHNYRMECIAGTHFRRDRICEDCGGGHRLAGLVHRCYRSSWLQSFLMTKAMQRLLDLARDGAIDRLVCLDPFVAQRLERAGVASSRIRIRRNGVEPCEPYPFAARDGVLFAGRLTSEKGILGLVQAWPDTVVRLRVLGTGPLLSTLTLAARERPIDVLGEVPLSSVASHMGGARCFVAPSRWFEGGVPLTVQEAMASGTPTLVYDLGCMSSLRGLCPDWCIPPDDAEAMVARAIDIATMPADEWRKESIRAQEVHRTTYDRVTCGRQLAEIYAELLAEPKPGKGACVGLSFS